MKPTLIPLLLAAAHLASALATTDGKASGLGAKDIRMLRGTSHHILLPTSIPKGYRFSAIVVADLKDPKQFSFGITYVKGKSEIMFQEASDGLGDLVFEDPEDSPRTSGKQPFTSAILGRGVVEYQHVKGRSQWLVTWMPVP